MNIKVVLYHRLPAEIALKRVKCLLDNLKHKYAEFISDLSEDWQGTNGSFRVSIAGFKCQGRLEVSAVQVVISGNLPILAAPFKGKIESMIKEEGNALLSAPIEVHKTPIQPQPPILQSPIIRSAVSEEKIPLGPQQVLVDPVECISEGFMDSMEHLSQLPLGEIKRRNQKFEKHGEPLAALGQMPDEELREVVDKNRRLLEKTLENWLPRCLEELPEHEQLVLEAYALDRAGEAIMHSTLDHKLYRGLGLEAIKRTKTEEQFVRILAKARLAPR